MYLHVLSITELISSYENKSNVFMQHFKGKVMKIHLIELEHPLKILLNKFYNFLSFVQNF